VKSRGASAITVFATFVICFLIFSSPHYIYGRLLNAQTNQSEDPAAQARAQASKAAQRLCDENVFSVSDFRNFARNNHPDKVKVVGASDRMAMFNREYEVVKVYLRDTEDGGKDWKHLCKF
jgi:hypothetical protein